MQIVIFHGTFGSKDGNWFPWLKGELEAKGHKVLVPQFPVEDHELMTQAGPDNYICSKQNLKKWLEYFKNKVLPVIDPKEKLVFIGHSLSPLFILHLLENFDIKLKMAIFVSPFLHLELADAWQYNLVNKNFFKPDLNFDLINSRIRRSIVFYGDNDPYVPQATALEFAQKLNAKVVKITGGGHLNSEFHYDSFPELLEYLK